jgi:tryptophan-rich sensory protein
MAQQQSWQAVKRSIVSGKTLYDDLKSIPIYKNHRESLRPWDRKLPAIVEQEANRRSMWIIRPPSGYSISGVLLLCLLALVAIPLIPFLTNEDFIRLTWRDIEKPPVVYHDPRVLFAVLILVHVCSAFSVWFMYLSEGFNKHQLELVPFCLAVLCECVWMDVTFYVGRLDWTLMLWCAIFVLTLITQALLVWKEVSISMIFLLPQLAGALVVMVYTIEFIKIHGTQLQRQI